MNAMGNSKIEYKTPANDNIKQESNPYKDLISIAQSNLLATLLSVQLMFEGYCLYWSKMFAKSHKITTSSPEYVDAIDILGTGNPYERKEIVLSRIQKARIYANRHFNNPKDINNYINNSLKDTIEAYVLVCRVHNINIDWLRYILGIDI